METLGQALGDGTQLARGNRLQWRANPCGDTSKVSANPATSSSHPCGASAPAPVLPVASPPGKGSHSPPSRSGGGRMANFTPLCQASSQHTSTASCPAAPVPSHPPPSPPSDLAIKTSVAVKRLMCVGGGGGGEQSGSHEPGPRLLQPPKQSRASGHGVHLPWSRWSCPPSMRLARRAMGCGRC